MLKKHPQKLSSAEVSYFCRQMSLIIKSGISTLEGLSIMMEEEMSPEGNALMKKMYHTLSETGCFYQAVCEADAFPEYFLDMIHIGETSGRLDDVLSSLDRYYTREDSVKKGIRSAITYPFVMIGLLILIVGVLVVKVLPIFNQVYIQLGSNLTGFAKILMDFGSFLGRYYIPFIILFVIVMGFLFYGSSKLKFSKKMQLKIALERFTSGMALTLASGLDTDYSLELAEKLIDFAPLKKKIARCRALTGEGISFSEALKTSGIFSGLYAHMLEIGFTTGRVDEVMQQAAAQYEEEAEQYMTKLISVLEPSLVAVLSVIVGMILLSVMLPLMGIMSGIAS